MPIYEYKCEQGHVFDVIQKMSDEPVTECEECGAPVARVLHSPAVHFKGSGFYNTDYGKQKKGANGGAEGGDAKPADAGSKSSDSKSSDSGSSDSKAKAATGD
jgi:putative FmdB family regulatory protein